MSKLKTGFAIAIAWPQTYCKQPGSWYDGITAKLGVNKNNYYKAGHAALVLVDKKSGNCYYFDFGRYHTPFQYGRVRNSTTDDDLTIKTKAMISDDKNRIENFEEILNELQLNTSCHGDGELKASYCEINFQSALDKANNMQGNSPLQYGPFISNGSNCSRFVNSVIVAGKPNINHLLNLKYFIFITPTPMNNINSLKHKIIIPVRHKHIPFSPVNILSKEQINNTLLQPEKNQTIPHNAQWLSGEGAGSWFAFKESKGKLYVTRYSPNGKIECNGIYEGAYQTISLDSITITYPSNCNKIYIMNDNKPDILTRISKN